MQGKCFSRGSHQGHQQHGGLIVKHKSPIISNSRWLFWGFCSWWEGRGSPRQLDFASSLYILSMQAVMFLHYRCDKVKIIVVMMETFHFYFFSP